MFDDFKIKCAEGFFNVSEVLMSGECPEFEIWSKASYAVSLIFVFICKRLYQRVCLEVISMSKRGSPGQADGSDDSRSSDFVPNKRQKLITFETLRLLSISGVVREMAVIWVFINPNYYIACSDLQETFG